MRKALLPLLALAILFSVGCGEQEIASGLQAYFPGAQIIPGTPPGYLMIDTRLSGVSEKFLETLTPIVMQKFNANVGFAGVMGANQTRFFIMRYDDAQWFTVWDTASGVCYIWTREQFTAWAKSMVGQ